MKTLIQSLATLLLISFWYTPLKAQSSEFETIKIKTEIVCDHCMTCETCGEHIFDAIKRNTKGVRKIDIQPETNTIEVKYKVGKTSQSEIEKAISSAGYKANDLAPDPNAYGKLDGCCKGQGH